MSEFPSEWKVLPLSEVAERVRRTSDDQNLDVLTISSTEGWVDQKKKWARDMAGKSIEKYTLLHQGEFSYNKGNSKTYPQGCIFRLENWHRALVPNVYHSFSVINPEADEKFLQHLFASGGLNDQLRSVITSSVRDNGLLNITADTFFSSEIPIPPLPEQKKIAEILSGIDEQISLMKKDLERIKTTKYAILMQLTCNAGQGDLSELCKNWEEVTIEEICEIHDSKRIPLSGEQRQSRKGIYPYYGANNIQDYIDDFIFDFDSVLLAEDGGYYEQHSSKEIAQHATGKYWVNNHAHILTSKEGATTKFIYYSLVHKNICSWINTGTRAKLNQSDLKQITIPLPPLESQEKSVKLLDSFESAVNSKIRKISKLSCIKQAISTDLLSGRKRVSI